MSAASAWEIGIKRSTGKLRAPPDLEARIEAHRFEPLAITVAHALEAADLPPHHADPFDRMLVAQARAEKLTLVSSDRRLAAYEVDVLAA